MVPVKEFGGCCVLWVVHHDVREHFRYRVDDHLANQGYIHEIQTALKIKCLDYHLNVYYKKITIKKLLCNKILVICYAC